VSAPSAGIVRSVHVRAGDVVGRGAPLIELEES
jgi:biotin carboxyl carrier protein